MSILSLALLFNTYISLSDYYFSKVPYIPSVPIVGFDNCGDTPRLTIYERKYDNAFFFVILSYISSKKQNSNTWENIYYGYNGKISQKGCYVKNHNKYGNDSEKNGIRKYFNDDGTIGRVISYKNGICDGIFQEFGKNGKIKNALNYKNGALDGKQVFFNDQGKLLSIKNYNNCFLDGKQLYFRDNGIIEKKENYYLGRLHGEQFYYDEDGNLKETSIYYYGSKEGIYDKIEFTYDKTGYITEEKRYRGGKLVGDRYWEVWWDGDYTHRQDGFYDEYEMEHSDELYPEIECESYR